MMFRKVSLFLLMVLLSASVPAASLNGIDTGTLQVVKVTERASSMSAIHNVKHVAAAGDWRQDTYVIGAVINGQAVAYPLAVLMWHWVLNDTIANQAIVVVYCQICGSGWLYERSFGDDVLTFKASGLLYQYDMLLFDDKTKSLWSWGTDSAVAGPFKNTALTSINSETTTLRAWLKNNPDTLIIEASCRVTGIDYRFTPNDTSALGESVFSGLRVTVTEIHPYTPVVGVIVNEQAVAIPASSVFTTESR